MMKQVESISGVILRADKHKESDLRISIFTPQGVKVLYAIGALKPNAKLRAALQQFNIVELSTAGTRITGAQVITSGFGLTKEINRFYLASGIAETLMTLFKQELHLGEGQEIYTKVVETIILLSSTDISCYKIYIRFFGTIIKILGYDIENDMIQEFIGTEPQTLDEIPLTLTEAKRNVKILHESYFDSLEVILPKI